MKFLQLIPKHKGWRTTHHTGRKPPLSFLCVLNSSPNCSDDYSDCLLLDPAHLGGKGAFIFISCCIAVNHLAHIYTSDWLTAGKVNLSPQTWTCFSTLFRNKESKFYLLGSLPIVTRMSPLAPRICQTTPAFQKLLKLGQMELPGFYVMGYHSRYL